MHVPTMIVKVKATGHECLINVSDFNPAIHAKIGEKVVKSQEPKQAEETQKEEANQRKKVRRK